MPRSGLAVEIIAPADPADPPKMAAAGKVDLAVSYQPQLYLQHEAKLPLVRVGTLVNNPLYCVMVDADGPVKSLADLAGRKVGFSIAGIEEALMHTMLRSNGVDPKDVEQINVNFSLTPALVAGQVEAVSNWLESNQLRIARVQDRIADLTTSGDLTVSRLTVAAGLLADLVS